MDILDILWEYSWIYTSSTLIFGFGNLLFKLDRGATLLVSNQCGNYLWTRVWCCPKRWRMWPNQGLNTQWKPRILRSITGLITIGPDFCHMLEPWFEHEVKTWDLHVGINQACECQTCKTENVLNIVLCLQLTDPWNSKVNSSAPYLYLQWSVFKTFLPIPHEIFWYRVSCKTSIFTISGPMIQQSW